MKRVGTSRCGMVILLLALGLVGCGGNPTESVQQTSAAQSEAVIATVEETMHESEPETVVEEEAKNMLLNHFEGELAVTEEGSALAGDAVYDGMKLLSGDSLETAQKSYAWIGLDDVKELKMDEISISEIQKEGKNLVIQLVSGNMFFHVAEALESDEQMNIRTANMDIAIRGTTGIVEKISDKETEIVLLEGHLELDSGSFDTVDLNTGECAHIVTDKYGHTYVYKRNIYGEDIPAFVNEEIGGRSDIQAKILDRGGDSDPEGNPFLPAVETLLVDHKGLDGSKLYFNKNDWCKGGDGGEFSIGDVDGDGEDEIVVVWNSYGDKHTFHCGIYSWDTAAGKWIREDDFERSSKGDTYAYSPEFYEGGTAIIRQTFEGKDDWKDVTYCTRYSAETKRFVPEAIVEERYNDQKGAREYLITCEEKQWNGEVKSDAQYREFMDEFTNYAEDIVLEKMPVLENSVMRLKSISTYREDARIQDGTYVNSSETDGLSRYAYMSDGDEESVNMVGTWKFTGDDGTSSETGMREIAFPINDETVFRNSGGTETSSLEEFAGSLQWSMWDSGHITVKVKDGVVTEVYVKE